VVFELGSRWDDRLVEAVERLSRSSGTNY